MRIEPNARGMIPTKTRHSETKNAADPWVVTHVVRIDALIVTNERAKCPEQRITTLESRISRWTSTLSASR